MLVFLSNSVNISAHETRETTMSDSAEEDGTPDTYLKALKAEGAELLMQATRDDAHARARLSLIDAKIDQLTRPITSESWVERED